jgi:hypothetical protein
LLKEGSIEGTGVVDIYRPPGITDIFRSYRMLMDDIQIGVIGRGKRFEFRADIGRHSLQLKIDWCVSNKVSFDLSEEGVSLVCGSRYEGAKLPLASLFLISGSRNYLWLKLADPSAD